MWVLCACQALNKLHSWYRCLILPPVGCEGAGVLGSAAVGPGGVELESYGVKDPLKPLGDRHANSLPEGSRGDNQKHN